MSVDAADHQLTTVLTDFAIVLRQGGLQVSITRLEALLAGVTALGPFNLWNIYWVGRATICSSQQDLKILERCFGQFFLTSAKTPTQPSHPKTLKFSHFTSSNDADSARPEASDTSQDVSLVSANEVLQHREFSEMTQAEREQILKLIDRLKPLSPKRRSPRQVASKRGVVDIRQTVRAAFAYDGDPFVLRYQGDKLRTRKCVFLIDISGSMKPYAEPLLRFAFAAQRANPGTTHVFTIGTRLSYLTPTWRNTPAELALESAGRTITDWQGGTRLGEQLQYFLDHWGQRGMVRGAATIIASDGWEQGDASLLGAQMKRLKRLAHCVIWTNPHQSGVGYEPVAKGMQAALPHIDRFVSGCTAAELEGLATTISAC